MPGPTLPPFETDHRLPPRVDVVVIGGGIIGVSTALELAERGVSVLLCEKGQIAGEQSSRNWGWVRLSQRDVRELPLMVESVRIWQGLDERVGRATGYKQTGILFDAPNERAISANENWAENLRAHQIESRIVTGDELAELVPGHRTGKKAALYTPVDGRAEPQLAAPAIADAARAAGATVMTNCAVRSIDREGGQLTGIVTEKGRVKCDAVVLAGGAWSRLFAGNAGVWLPQLKVLSTVLRTTPVDGPETAFWSSRYAYRKRQDGGYTVAQGSGNLVDIVPDSFRLARHFLAAYRSEWRSLRFRLSSRWRVEASELRQWRPDQVTPFENCRVLDPAPSERVLRNSWAALCAEMPIFKQADIVQSWAGLIDVTPDAIPVISGVDDLPGLYIATGFSGHGFGIGPGAGRLMADLVCQTAPVVDPTDFRLSRFTDGSRITLQSGV